MRFYYKIRNSRIFDKNGKIKKEYKFKLNFPEFGIVDSKVLVKKDEKFNTYLFLPEGEGRKGEGGLRTKGYFKFNYKLINNKWYFCNFYGNPIKPVDEELEKKIKEYVETNSSDIKELPLITVITVVFNGEKYLEETIQSVINQIYPNIEYIIIDGGSTDKTLDIIKKYEAYIDYWVSEKDSGMYDALNKGLLLATGQIYGSLNADDKYFLNTIKNVINIYTKQYPDVIYGKPCFLYNNEKISCRNLFLSSYQDLLSFGNCTLIPQPCTFIKLRLAKKVGFFDLNFKVASDYDYLIRCLKTSKKVEYVNKFFTLFRRHENSLTEKESSLMYIESMKILKKHNFNYPNSKSFFLKTKYILKNPIVIFNKIKSKLKK